MFAGSRFVNILEATISQNNVWLEAYNHPNQFPKYSNPQKSSIQGRRLGVDKTQDT